ncbi:GGDEF domain-containing protein [Thiorhodovibrio frisius]|uniref:Diguanylate cyclase (GGDEF) domain-containing protein n=1 Tax=Thiorhodovibrio frisius TaxID=631362 RepID=H8Z5D8_9GAMM|nr:GGDEF domain-containing protein [Thiorhodovibrio frisius]EIC20545.1 diguanylate cyclase (GGDEF) domain-containing protein [Thiorhodovibrio frisius]WPL21293.1 Cyclic di-GMP phosphodiesterase Gmr [Thiorhodovibrio frisius]
MAVSESNQPPDGDSVPALKPDSEQESKADSRREFIRLFGGLILLIGLLTGLGSYLFYRAELAEVATPAQQAAAVEVAGEASIASNGQATGVRAERRGTLMRLWLFALTFFVLMGVAAWFLTDARVKWRREQKRAQELANFDTVTELPNRALFFDRLERIHLHSARYRRRYGLILLDLDGFGEVNDKFGYSDGDRLLVRVGRMLTNSLRNSDTVARVGGDEFAVLLSEVNGVEAAMTLGRKVVGAVAAPIRLSSGEAEITASVGVAVFPEHASSVDDMLRAANEAMDRAKREGQGRCLMALSPDEYPNVEELAAGLIVEDSPL